jgi:predicted HicB family RNase H-like nuclease
MAEKTHYVPGSDVPDDETLRDSKGRVIDDDYVEAAVGDALRRVRGRPSLSESGESPLLRVRISRDLDDAVRQAAQRAGKSRAEWVRQVLARAAESKSA